MITAGALQAQKFEGLALTPPMGWNSWNKFGKNINEKLIREIADAMVSSGLRDAGYIYLNIDDYWQAAERDAYGFILPDPDKFPSGILALSDYAHGKGLKLGVYSDGGRKTCGGRPGSNGHEYQDAIKYAEWGVDYLKYDWCNTDGIEVKTAYNTMRDALYKAGRPIVFSMCEWGKSRPWEWAQNTGHLWRTTGDIGPYFDSVHYHNGWHDLGVLTIIELNNVARKGAGPGHWNDPDMLEVGNGLSVNQDRAHFTMWCMMAAPLILGNDVRNMTKETKEIVLNREVIAVDQDSLGVQGFRYRDDDGLEIWFKPLVNDEWAVCLFNRTTVPRNFVFHWNDYRLTDELSGRSTTFNNTIYTVRDLWQKRDAGTTEKLFKLTIPAQDVILYRIKPQTKAAKKR